MLICLLRHGIAEEFNPSRHRHDSDRALTEQGRLELTQQVAGLTQLELPIDVIVKSPYVRAAETAQLASAAFG
jgi:phosphohistidine phosphatase